MKVTRMTLLALPALAVCAATANGALITGITVESATDNPWNAGSGMYPIKAINGAGLPGGTPALSGTHDNSMPNNWWSTTVPAQITINLSGNYAVDTIHVWNYNENGFTARGTQNVEIYVSPDGDIANLVKLVTTGTGGFDNGSGGFLFPQSPGGDIPGFDLDLSSVTNAALLANVRLIQLTPLDNYGDFGVGLAEVQFGGVVVPEPSAALLGGLGLLALLRRRRNA